MKISKKWKNDNNCTLFHGDCADLLRKLPDESVDLVLTSPPYCIGKVYEDKTKAEDFEVNHASLLPEIVRVTKKGGSICWQVGYHVKNAVVTPLDYIIYDLFRKFPEIVLRNRIIWTFGHGFHANDRFSGRHETIMWFTKGNDYLFNLDAVRVLQKYPGKKAYKGKNKGTFSGNPLGKNPSDVWDIPNVKANHIEKSQHPCQFPIALAQRCINAFSTEQGLVLDPYFGSGSTAAAAVMLNRRFVGSEIEKKYYLIAEDRVRSAIDGTLIFRPDGVPVLKALPGKKLTTVPSEWRIENEPNLKKAS